MVSNILECIKSKTYQRYSTSIKRGHSKSETYVDDDGKEKSGTRMVTKANVTTHNLLQQKSAYRFFKLLMLKLPKVLNSESVNSKHKFSHT